MLLFILVIFCLNVFGVDSVSINSPYITSSLKLLYNYAESYGQVIGVNYGLPTQSNTTNIININIVNYLETPITFNIIELMPNNTQRIIAASNRMTYPQSSDNIWIPS
jgi:hypothetical protein